MTPETAAPPQSVRALTMPFAGVLGVPREVPAGNELDAVFSIRTVSSGSVQYLFRGALGEQLEFEGGRFMPGAGTDSCSETAELKAICEAAERFCACYLDEEECRVASANELGDEAFDWRALPRLSDEELDTPRRFFHHFDPDALIRWVPAFDIVTSRRRYVPMVMTHMLPRSWTRERFWNRISTGLAVHTDPRTAIVSAICEVIERDATALTWLLRIPLPRIQFDAAELEGINPAIRSLLDLKEYRIYDATTDYGLPVVYAHRRRPTHPYAANLIACASGFDLDRVVARAVEEVVALSSMLDNGGGSSKADRAECTSISDGAVYMAQPARATAFDFLENSGARVRLGELRERHRALRHMSPAERIEWLSARARQRGDEILVTELTTDELRDVGLRGFRALVPAIMPMSTVYSCRYLATHRLREYNRLLNRPAFEISDLNPEPQPFA